MQSTVTLRGRAFAGALAAASMVFTASAVAQQSILHKVLDRGELRIGTTGDFNPMSFKDPETKQYKGHQIDAAMQLAQDMGVTATFVATDWKTLINGVVADKYDIVMTGT
ncbi:MAG: transporter substrate-binding domain-containing protein, partial [Gammaproteobacteria bacterium]